jgi:hypothetical protein
MKRTGIVLAGLLLYVLSVGPAVRFDVGIIHLIHRPLYWAAGYRIPGTLLASYTSLWLPHNGYAFWDAHMGVVIIEGNSLVGHIHN